LNSQILKDFSSCAFVCLQNDFHYASRVGEFRIERNTIAIEFTLPGEGEYIYGWLGGQAKHVLGIGRLDVWTFGRLDISHCGGLNPFTMGSMTCRRIQYYGMM
jgi:hypothetical protein